jgi:hypothetical protein
MPEKRVKVPNPFNPGAVIEGSEVGVTESTERWSDILLEDGSRLRVKPSIIGAIRLDGMFDQDGNPAYALKGSQTSIVVSSPEHLRKGKQMPGKVQ